MTDLLLSPPWWLYGSVIIIGLVVWASGNKRDEPRVRWTGTGIIALGALMAVLSFTVETDPQIVARQSKELVQSVIDADWNKFQSYLSPDAGLSIAGLPPLCQSRDQLVTAGKLGVQKYGLHSASSNIEDSKRDGRLISTTVRVYSTGDIDPGHPLPSLWQFDWEKAADGRWTVHEIHPLEIGNDNKGADMDALIPQAR